MATDIPARLTSGEARRFGGILAAAFGVIGAVQAWRGVEWLAMLLGGIAALFALSALLVPQALVPVHTWWMRLGHALSRITTPIFLTIVFVLVLTPIGLVMRLFGHHPLRHRLREDSYWILRPSNERRGDIERQF
jgi:Saxitoxin biosynthesis operon protein SxtJ